MKSLSDVAEECTTKNSLSSYKQPILWDCTKGYTATENVHWKLAVCSTVEVVLFRDWEKESHTISAQHERGWWPEDLAVCHSAGYDTGVISHIWWLHFGDVEVTSLLRHKSPAVLLDKWWILVEDPSKWQLWLVIKIKRFGKVVFFFFPLHIFIFIGSLFYPIL